MEKKGLLISTTFISEIIRISEGNVISFCKDNKNQQNITYENFADMLTDLYTKYNCDYPLELVVIGMFRKACDEKPDKEERIDTICDRLHLLKYLSQIKCDNIEQKRSLFSLVSNTILNASDEDIVNVEKIIIYLENNNLEGAIDLFGNGMALLNSFAFLVNLDENETDKDYQLFNENEFSIDRAYCQVASRVEKHLKTKKSTFAWFENREYNENLGQRLVLSSKN